MTNLVLTNTIKATVSGWIPVFIFVIHTLTWLIGFFVGDEDGYLNIALSLMSDRSLNSSANQEWWDIAIAGCAPSSCGVLPMVIFNDKVSPPSLGFLAGYG